MGLRHVWAFKVRSPLFGFERPGAPARGGDVCSGLETLEALRSWWWPRRSPTTCVKSELHDRPDVEGPRVQIEEFGHPRSINSRSSTCGSEESSTPPGSARAPLVDRRGFSPGLGRGRFRDARFRWPIGHSNVLFDEPRVSRRPRPASGGKEVVEMGESRTPRPEPLTGNHYERVRWFVVDRPDEHRHPAGRSSHVSLDRACHRTTRRSSGLHPR